ncbi:MULTISPECIES: helix-turn-helix domain-containing protein [unclassified Butyrivibrio]|uniref:helix-turn-helix domain-containing protein n=1 Tax=unclassified Butyrivibrio TaxID=2639466 RepID=UPI0003B62441|nr:MULTISPECIES: helix-turn-helix transcriptional regulator [unclassified Butyrivibrio]
MKTKEMETIGGRLRKLREDAGIGQKELAAEFYLSNKTVVSAYERNMRAIPVEVIVMYSDKFKVTTDWILKGKPESLIDWKQLNDVLGNSEMIELYESLADPEIKRVAREQMRALTMLRK